MIKSNVVIEKVLLFKEKKFRKFIMKNVDLTILIQKDIDSGWYVGQIEGFPAAISQVQTIEELKKKFSRCFKTTP